VSGREKQSVREAINILGESLESLLGDNVSDTANGDTSPHGETKEDISSLLAGEIADLKDKKKAGFCCLGDGHPINCILRMLLQRWPECLRSGVSYVG